MASSLAVSSVTIMYLICLSPRARLHRCSTCSWLSFLLDDHRAGALETLPVTNVLAVAVDAARIMAGSS